MQCTAITGNGFAKVAFVVVHICLFVSLLFATGLDKSQEVGDLFFPQIGADFFRRLAQIFLCNGINATYLKIIEEDWNVKSLLKNLRQSADLDLRTLREKPQHVNSENFQNWHVRLPLKLRL